MHHQSNIKVLRISGLPLAGAEKIRKNTGLMLFLWYLDSTQKFDSKFIERNLTAYYTGLANINVDKSKVTVDKLVTIKASIKKHKSETSDTQTFEGTVDILDYMTLKPLSLNLLIHIRYCKGQNKTFVFHEASPQPYSDNVWKSLNQLWTNFKCTKDERINGGIKQGIRQYLVQYDENTKSMTKKAVAT